MGSLPHSTYIQHTDICLSLPILYQASPHLHLAFIKWLTNFHIFTNHVELYLKNILVERSSIRTRTFDQTFYQVVFLLGYLRKHKDIDVYTADMNVEFRAN